MKKQPTVDTLENLIRFWETRDPDIWEDRADLYLESGKRALEFGHPALSFDILNEGMFRFPEQVYLIYWAALALARSSSTGPSAALLNKLLKLVDPGSPIYVDALSLSGRIAKDRWFKLRPGKKRQDAAKISAAHYRQAFEVAHDYFPGINAASMTMLADQIAEGQEIARHVYRICASQKDTVAPDDYWFRATFGEACLLLDSQQEAVEWYAEAARMAGDRYGDIASMRRQINMLSTCLDISSAILDALAIPRVVAFTGHMIDATGRQSPRFPADLESVVKCEIQSSLEKLDAGFGFSSAACGADIMFIEAMLDQGAEVKVVLPFSQDDFIETSVAFAGKNWQKRFRLVLSRATEVIYATKEKYLQDDILFQYTGNLIQGMAQFQADQLQVEPVMLAVIDPKTPTVPGGTGETLEAWRRQGHVTEIIDLDSIRKKSSKLSATAQKKQSTPSAFSPQSKSGHHEEPRIARQIKAMLFADVVAFSKLGEENAPSFFVGFLGKVANLIACHQAKPAFFNTWGDGLFLVFNDIADAADFALQLRDMVLSTQWDRLGLPADTNIRVGMHAGPVFEAFDPILKSINYYGTHVNQTARIEQVTAAGAVFVSEQFACLLAASGSSAFASDYLGTVELAKKFGSNVLYRLRRAAETE